MENYMFLVTTTGSTILHGHRKTRDSKSSNRDADPLSNRSWLLFCSVLFQQFDNAAFLILLLHASILRSQKNLGPRPNEEHLIEYESVACQDSLNQKGEFKSQLVFLPRQVLSLILHLLVSLG